MRFTISQRRWVTALFLLVLTLGLSTALLLDPPTAISSGAHAPGQVGAVPTQTTHDIRPRLYDPNRSARIAQGAPSAGRTWTVEGIVIDKAGSPVVDAEVVLVGPPSRGTRTDSDGSFHIDASSLVGLPTTRVFARKGSEASTAVDVDISLERELVLILGSARKLQVRVLAESRAAPIVGAEVVIAELGLRELTDGDGNARFPAIPEGVYNVVAGAHGYATGRWLLDPNSVGDGRLTLMLTAGHDVTGSVRFEDGRAAAGARISWTGINDLVSSPDSAVADANGEFMVRLRNGTYYFSAAHPPHTTRTSTTVHVSNDADESGRLELRLVRGGAITGIVVNGRGEPAVADVTASPADGSGARRTKSDAQSGFTFDGLQGRVELRARNDSGVAAPMVVQVKAGEPATRVELRLAETYRIAGVVVDASGAPVPGALVGATPVTDVQNQRRFFTATSSPDGRFELLDVPAGTFGLRAGVGHSADGFTFWSLPAKRAQAGDQDVVLTIAATGSLQGTVLFEEGGSPSQYSIHIGGKIATFGDPKFSLEGIPAAAHTLVVTSPEATVRTVDEVMVVAGQERDIGEIKLHRGMTVVGVVVRANGKPAPLAKVVAGKTLLTLSNTVDAALSTPFMGRRQTVADEEGRFRLSGVEEGSVLVAESETGRSDATPLVGAEDVTLVLRETGGIQGKYIWPDGGSGKLAVGASPQAEPSLRFVAAAGLDGTFEFRGLAPGKYLITIATNDEADTQSMESTVVDIQPGTTLPLEVRGAARPANVDVQLEGSPTEHAVIFLVEGRIQPHTAMDIDHEIASRGGGAYRLRMVKFGSHALFKKAAPGLSTACAIPISEDPAQPDFGVKVQLSVTELPVFCAGGTVGPPGNQPTIIRIQLR